MSYRNYERLYVNKNREEGSEKVLLGYRFDQKEFILRKDQETSFHVPFFTEPFNLAADNTLILNGAIGGPFPAASDRIFKSRKNYGQVTPYGTSTVDTSDGTWFCSWLYKNESGQLSWLDRIYNPSSDPNIYASTLNYQAPNFSDARKIFRDVPSKMQFEPGLLYKYFHLGEKTFAELTTTFDGVSGERLLLHLADWSSEQPNKITTSLQPTVLSKNNKTDYAKTLSVPGRVETNVLNFNAGAQTEAVVNFSTSYNPTDEFGITFWANCSEWTKNPSTQLIGNYSSKGGYGLFLQNLESFPFFVITETNYGHILFVNTFGNGYYDKIIQIVPGVNDIPIFSAFDMNHHLLVCNKDDTGSVYKFDNLGNLIASTKTADNKMQFSDFSETPLQLLCGPGNSVYVLTSKMMYVLDEHLSKINQLPITFSENDVAAFRYDVNTDFSELIIINNVYDAKFIGLTQWYISKTDGNLYRKLENGSIELFYRFRDIATNIAIDPNNHLWVLHGTNKLTVLDPTGAPTSSASVIVTTNVGLNTSKNHKNINFFTDYQPNTNSYEWRAIIYYSSQDETSTYFLNLQGQPIKTINTNSLFDQKQVQSLKQESKNFKYLGKGDFTGYEHKRIFKQLSPYRNSNQLVFKTSLKDSFQKNLAYKTYTKLLPISSWTEQTWQHFGITLENNTFRVYINSEMSIELPFSGRYKLSYEMQPLLFIGTSAGSQVGLNQEIQHVSDAFVGQIGDIKIHDYPLSSEQLQIMIKSNYVGEHLTWLLPVPNLHYIEKIERMFKHKIPGSKTALYKIKIRGSEIQDPNAKALFEQQIRLTVNEIQPGFSDFLEVEWIE